MSRRFFSVFVFFLSACAAQPTAIIVPEPTLAPTDAPLTAPTIKEKFFLRDLPGAGRHPIDLASVGDKIYALNTETQNVAVIQNDRAIKYIAVGKQPAALAADAAQKRVYVSNAGDKSISLIADDQLALTQSIGEEARALIFFENRLWAGLANSATIITLDPTTLQIQNRIAIPGAFSIISLAGDAQNHRVYANIFDKTAVIDSTTLRVGSTINTKGSYSTLLAQPATDSVLVAIYDSASATQFLVAYNPSTGAERARVKLGGDPRGAIMNRDGSRIYVANSFTNDVSVIDARNFTSLATISIGLKPNAVALDENARRLYVANYESDSISAINSDTNEIVATIPLAMLVTAFETNDAAQRTYIANASTDSVFVMEGARVVKEILVGRHPIDLARDATSNRVFVAHQADGTLAIIDENNFSVSTTPVITRPLTSVAVDAPRARLFANDIVLDLKTLAPIGKLILRGQTVQSNLAPDFVRVNAAANRVYALGSNGVPGSNGRRVIYSVDGNNLQQRAPLSFNGNIHFIAFDPETNRVYGAGTHPLALTNEFSAWDLNDAKIFSLALAARTTGLAYNPQTHHLFLAHAASFGSTPNPNDNTIQILDTTTFGEITRLNVQAPGLIARIGNTIYVAGRDDGSITRIQDANIAAPPAPSPTFTLTPFQLLTPARTPTR